MSFSPLKQYGDLLRNIPPATNYEAIMEYCATLIAETTFLGMYVTELKLKYLKSSKESISKCDDEYWKKIKTSSSLINSYTEEQFEEFEEYENAKFLLSMFKDSLFNINTLIANNGRGK